MPSENEMLRRFQLLQSKGEFSEIGGRDVRTVTCNRCSDAWEYKRSDGRGATIRARIAAVRHFDLGACRAMRAGKLASWVKDDRQRLPGDA